MPKWQRMKQADVADSTRMESLDTLQAHLIPKLGQTRDICLCSSRRVAVLMLNAREMHLPHSMSGCGHLLIDTSDPENPNVARSNSCRRPRASASQWLPPTSHSRRSTGQDTYATERAPGLRS
ncbi:hypothetical protein MPTK2_1g23270 [Marchantia polymorpha subsp. ruderalis]